MIRALLCFLGAHWPERGIDRHTSISWSCSGCHQVRPGGLASGRAPQLREDRALVTRRNASHVLVSDCGQPTCRHVHVGLSVDPQTVAQDERGHVISALILTPFEAQAFAGALLEHARRLGE